ncbi:MAG: hypothetical protein K8E24_013110, partial [Methanobacterium paludis]|nr:hypothetical protein [Methanobacterium paludis]
MRVEKPFAQIMFKKYNQNKIYNVDWIDWDLKRSLDELSQFTCTINSPDTWIDFNSETGFIMDIGDEIYFNGIYSRDSERKSLQFGGTIEAVDPSWDGKTSLAITSVDFRQLYKERQVFQNYYKVLPLQYSNSKIYEQQLVTSNTLHEIITNLSNMCGVTDLSLLEDPYLFMNSTGVPFNVTIGGHSTVTSDLNFGSNKPSIKIHTSSLDSNFRATIYEDVDGYDAVTYPVFAFKYHQPKTALRSFLFRFTINGNIYYAPWGGSGKGQTDGYLLGGSPWAFTDTFRIGQIN